MIRVYLPGKPLYINALSQGSHWQISNERKFWKGYAQEVARFTRVPKATGPVVVHVRHMCSGRLPDSGAVYHAAKGAQDGLVDAGVLKDDSARYVRGLMFWVPVKAHEDALTIELVEAEDALTAENSTEAQDSDEAHRMELEAQR